MADPVSVAGSAVGVISIAIQVCQGLRSYYTAWTSYNGQVNHVCNKIDGLNATLENLQLSLEKLGTNTPAARNVFRSIASCEDGVNALGAMLVKLSAIKAPQGVREKVHNYSLQTLFPLKQDTLHSTSAMVMDLQSNLNSALQTLELYVSSASGTAGGAKLIEYRDILAGHGHVLASIKSISSSTDGEVRDIQRRLDTIDVDSRRAMTAIPDISQQMDKMTVNAENITSNLENISERVETTIAHKLDEYGRQNFGIIQRLEESLLHRNAQLEKINLVIKNLQMSLIQKPGLFQSVYDESSHLESPTDLSSYKKKDLLEHDSSPASFKTAAQRCTCQPRIIRKNSSRTHGKWFPRESWNVAFYTANSTHRKGCPTLLDSSHTIGLRFSYCGYLLARTLQASMSFTRGAGGFSISPTMSFSALVPSDSPVFRLLDFTFSSKTSVQDMSRCFDLRIHQIVHLYETRAASPYDVDQDGNTMLHKACTLFRLNADHLTVNDSVIEIYLGFLRKLQDLCVPLNKTNALGFTFLNELVDSYASLVSRRREAYLTTLSLKVLEMGAELQLIPPELAGFGGNLSDSTFPYIAHEPAKFDDFAEALDCSDISTAVLHQSEPLLRKAIKASPQSINQPNNIGQTPLHLSLDWPCGIDILLEAGADVDRADSDGLPPIVYACQRSLIEAVRRLASADCALYPPNMPWFFQWHSVLQNAMREEVTFYPPYLNITVAARQNVVDCVIDSVADRRRRLQALASAFLPSKVADRLNLSGHLVLDEFAASTASTLLDHHVHIPDALSPGFRRTTVYHIPFLTLRTAHQLWTAGFRDTDGFDHRGRTPLMIRRYSNQINLTTELELIAWFLSKGADLHRAQHKRIRQNEPKSDDVSALGSKPNTTVVHWIAKNIGQTIKDFLWESINHRLSYVGPSWTLKHLAEERHHQLWQSFYEFMSISNLAKQVLLQILTDPIRDKCSCFCSVGGCQPIITILKIFRRDTSPVGRKMKTQISMVLAALIESTSSSSSSTSSSPVSALVRCLTFEELELTHTCCTHFLDHIVPRDDHDDDMTDVHEIHDEEHHLHDQLEELLVEFDAKQRELGVSTAAFLQGYWRARMDEVLAEKPDGWDGAPLERIGVCIV
ncbi:hypothetical protein MMC07_006616 [Pseudocyphellaria aurata]|nr:hypothetical protein [Pseudocyphellaria aurata]